MSRGSDSYQWLPLVLMWWGCMPAVPETMVADAGVAEALVPDSGTPDSGTVRVVNAADDDALAFDVLEGLVTIVPDLNGDGHHDWLLSDRTKTEVHTGGWPGAHITPVAFVRTASNLRAVVGDLNADGIPDLVLSSWSDHRVHVYFGPFTGTAKSAAEAFVVSRDPGGGLMDLFGSATLATDLTGDGIADLLVTAPSEGEEGCFGVRPSLVYVGPLGPGRGSSFDGMPVGPGEDDGPRPCFIFEAIPGQCLGDEVEVVDSAGQRVLVLIGSKVHGFSLPLSASRPIPLPEADTPKHSAEHQVAVDVDRDGLADQPTYDRVTGSKGWIRSSDGKAVYWTQGPTYLVLLDFNRDGLALPRVSKETFNAGRYGNDVILVPIAAESVGEVDLTQVKPAQTWFRSGWSGPTQTRGDVDGDGVEDVAYGNVLIRRARTVHP